MYKIKLPVFEGPFDLLLFLIRKNEIDIYDIPIAQITREYLEYIELMKMLDLEVAGEFIEMVATLILIKTRMLLPGQESGEEVGEAEDPRLQLTLQLLEYKRFKESSTHLKNLETERRNYFPRKIHSSQKKVRISEQAEEEFTIDATLFDLLTAFKTALDNMPKITVHQVKTVRVTIEDQVKYIFEKFEDNTHILFSELVKPMPEKIYLIVTFLAILDLMRLKMISVKQSAVFGEIRLVPLTELSMSRYLGLREEIDIGIEAKE